jgi:hypothetical protein
VERGTDNRLRCAPYGSTKRSFVQTLGYSQRSSAETTCFFQLV